MIEAPDDDKVILPDTSRRDVRYAAIRLLSRREHSVVELTRKLKAKGFDLVLIEQTVHELAHENLLSDERFAESYQRSRRGSGYGPIRIQQELKQRGTNEDVIAAVVVNNDPSWDELAKQVREKRFGTVPPNDAVERAKQMRFLQYRGFTHQQLKYAFSDEVD